jgi:outer membrane protein, heavy metal efflux system
VQKLIIAVYRLVRLESVCVRSVSFRRANSIAASVLTAVAMVGLSGCATYRSSSLPLGANLAANPEGLDATIQANRANYLIRGIDISRPLTINQIGLLAILNDPDLKSERGELEVARAGVLQATLLPNPSANLSYGALVGGPGTTSSMAASLSQDFVAIITRHARVSSAKRHLNQVDADQLWREWQVAQKARQLALDIHSENRSIDLMEHEGRLIGREVGLVRSAIAAGNLTLAALAPLLAVEAATEQSLVTLRLSRLRDWQALDGLLGLDPTVRVRIVPPVFHPLPRDLNTLVTSLPERRPDLIALRFGYHSAEEDVRAAILGQFPALALGGSYGSDTSAVATVGPTFTFALPIFDRNQGNIAKTQATRLLLHEQYQARLDKTVANVYALIAQLKELASDLVQARKAATAAQSMAATARRAYAQHNLDQRSLTDYERTEFERALEVVTIERQIGENRIFLAVELALGLPPTRIALSGRTEL